jgi:hypothetical protein
VHPAVDERREHDSRRDQRCGTDDFHGRSSLGGSGEPPDLLQSFDFRSDRAARARLHERMPARRLALPSVGGYLAGSEACLNGPGGPLEIAVNTESGIQDVRNLLVFFVARGPFVR